MAEGFHCGVTPMSTTAGTTLVHTGSHWGAYDVEVENGRIVGVRAFDGDPQPSQIMTTMPSAVYAESRIEQPMVRQGWLQHGVGSNRAGRGESPGNIRCPDHGCPLRLGRAHDH